MPHSRTDNIFTTHPASLDDLPQYSAWPSRLLGIVPWTPKKKNQNEILREYDREKWQPMLKYFEKHHSAGVSDVNSYELGQNADVFISRGMRLFKTDLYSARRENVEWVVGEVLRWLPASMVVEFGAGAGEILFSVGRRTEYAVDLFAADCCPHALKLVQLLAQRERVTIQSALCDLRAVEFKRTQICSGAVFFTSFALSCVSDLDANFIRSLIKFRPKVVIHFEPCFEHCDGTTLLDLMRKRYIEVNGYNRNLMTLLLQAEIDGEIQIKSIEKNVFGLNPLFSASCVVWSPAS